MQTICMLYSLEDVSQPTRDSWIPGGETVQRAPALAATSRPASEDRSVKMLLMRARGKKENVYVLG